MVEDGGQIWGKYRRRTEKAALPSNASPPSETSPKRGRALDAHDVPQQIARRNPWRVIAAMSKERSHHSPLIWSFRNVQVAASNPSCQIVLCPRGSGKFLRNPAFRGEFCT